MTSSYETKMVSVGCVHGSHRICGSMLADDTETLLDTIQALYDKENDK